MRGFDDDSRRMNRVDSSIDKTMMNAWKTMEVQKEYDVYISECRVVRRRRRGEKNYTV